LHDYPLLFKLWSMSNIFLQKDNITILGDVYEYPINRYDNENKLIETITQKAVMLQIILVVNWKQRLFITNYDLEKSDIRELDLKDYNSWNDLKEFLITIWYDLEWFNIWNKIYESIEEDIEQYI